MGLFSKNWAKELDRADDFLADGVPVAALEIAERAERKAGPDERARAAGLVLRARQELLNTVLAKAEAAEAAGDFRDAADWLRSAAEREPSAMRKAEIEGRIASLLNRSDAEEDRWESAEITVSATDETPVDEGDLAFQYETLITMLRGDVRQKYLDRAPRFQQAVVDLHQGRVEAALDVLRGVADQDPKDGVAHLELGQALMFSGDAVAAREHLKLAWQELGELPLDDVGSLIVPALWAEASLEAGEASEVVKRLAPLSEPATGHLHLCWLFAKALTVAGEQARALNYLEELLPLVPADAELNLLFAEVLTAEGQVARARQGLERAIEASCGVGCASPAPHHPSFLLLARLHLRDGGDPERARELIAWIAKDNQGRLGRAEHEVLAEYYRATGDPTSAQAAVQEAERLARSGEGAEAPVAGDLSGSQGRVL